VDYSNGNKHQIQNVTLLGKPVQPFIKHQNLNL